MRSLLLSFPLKKHYINICKYEHALCKWMWVFSLARPVGFPAHVPAADLDFLQFALYILGEMKLPSGAMLPQ